MIWYKLDLKGIVSVNPIDAKIFQIINKGTDGGSLKNKLTVPLSFFCYFILVN